MIVDYSDLFDSRNKTIYSFGDRKILSIDSTISSPMVMVILWAVSEDDFKIIMYVYIVLNGPGPTVLKVCIAPVLNPLIDHFIVEP